MTTTFASPSTTPSDADLVTASRRGDRAAFGQIVRRYQAAVSGILYSWCGDLHRSEDLAQETFLSAWKSLSGLREPDRLGPWLCQIARHRAADDRRGAKRDPVRLAAVVPVGVATSTPTPSDQALSAEERDLLWRTLAQVAEPYRETMILYYRQSCSAADVAAVTDVSEDLVRQRLARGRQMLRDQLADVLERNLARSAPGPQFATAVVATLPGLGGKAVAGSLAGKAAVTSAKGGGIGVLSKILTWFGPAVALVTGVVSSVTSVRTSEPGRERRHVVRYVLVLWLLTFGGMYGFAQIGPLVRRYHPSPATFLCLLSLSLLVYGLIVAFVAFKLHAGRDALRDPAAEEGPRSLPQFITKRHQRKIIVVVTVLAGLGWMEGLALHAHDALGASVLAAVMVLTLPAGLLYLRQRPDTSTIRLAMSLQAFVGAVTVVMVNWRLYDWFAAVVRVTPEDLRPHLPRWGVNVLLLAILGVMFAQSLATFPRKRVRRPLNA